jgi:hypothetical protein
MFTKQDINFAEIALDPRRRAAAIKTLTFRRNILFWVACLMTLMIIPANFGGSNGAGVTAFCAVVQWMLVLKFESDIRLLRVVSRLREERNARA